MQSQYKPENHFEYMEGLKSLYGDNPKFQDDFPEDLKQEIKCRLSKLANMSINQLKILKQKLEKAGDPLSLENIKIVDILIKKRKSETTQLLQGRRNDGLERINTQRV